MYSIIPLSQICFRGDDFRQDYRKLSMLCATFPNVPIIAMTATANKLDRKHIKDSLGLQNCFELVANPDRKNIFYEKIIRHGQDIDAFEDICRPIANDLLCMKVDYPLTVIYMPLRWCGFIYRLFEIILGVNQYYPAGSLALPKNRLFICPVSCSPDSQNERRNPGTIEFANIEDKSGIGDCCFWNGSRYSFNKASHSYWPTKNNERIFSGNRKSRSGWGIFKSYPLL